MIITSRIICNSTVCNTYRIILYKINSIDGINFSVSILVKRQGGNTTKTTTKDLQCYKMQKENNAPVESHQYVGPYRLEKTLGKGQTGKWKIVTSFIAFYFTTSFLVVAFLNILILGCSESFVTQLFVIIGGFCNL